jgi:hypothetical protein
VLERNNYDTDTLAKEEKDLKQKLKLVNSAKFFILEGESE